MSAEATRQAAGPAAPGTGPRATEQGSLLDRPEVQQAGWVWGDDGAQPPQDAPLPALITVAMRLIGAFIGCTAQGTGISPAGLGVLRLLAARDGLKSSEVAARGWWTPGTVTSVVDTLVRDGYVERRREPADRRVVRLHLTDAGRRKAEQAVLLIGPKWRDAFGFVAPADEPVIRKFLIDAIDRFGTLIREERGQ
ncbi:MAG TPA: MarR family transcriptional regulator [Streptosporangiaceae bacterium]|nr:MarR family transcriptional regulator [Streptosporangiaceae bacterium]